MPSPMLPWGYTVIDPPPDVNSPVLTSPDVYGPFQPTTNTPQDEWSNVWTYPAAISKQVANQARLLFSSNAPAAQQAVPTNTGPAWYDIPGRISAATSAVNEGLQSTLIKVIVLVSIVGLLALFGMSYVQAKGTQLAK